MERAEPVRLGRATLHEERSAGVRDGLGQIARYQRHELYLGLLARLTQNAVVRPRMFSSHGMGTHVLWLRV